MRERFSARSLLFPLVPLYRSALALRELRLRLGMEPVRRLRFPVISIGNVSTGGSGKTPLIHVDVLSRGYGRKYQLPARVNPGGTAEEFGDEPLLIAREAGIPVYVAPQRYDAGVLAEAEGSQSTPIIHLLDDGFQHRQLARDVNILLLNRRDWQDGLLPAGNLREPLKAARRADVIAISADEPTLESDLRRWGWKNPVWKLHRRMEVLSINGPIVAFCGIARPEQFFAGLKNAGLSLAAQVAFPDHHRYKARDLDRLVDAARTANATALVTTEKDFVRLDRLAAKLPKSLSLKTARLTVVIEDQSAAIDWLLGSLGTCMNARH